MAVTAVTENHEFEVNNNPKLLYWTKKMSDDEEHFIALSRDFFSRSTVKRFKTVICRKTQIGKVHTYTLLKAYT